MFANKKLFEIHFKGKFQTIQCCHFAFPIEMLLRTYAREP